MKTPENKKIGKIMPGDTPVQTSEVWEVTFEDDQGIERSVVMQTMPDKEMTILNKETNKRFVISWGWALGLAIDAGLLTQEESNND